MCDLVTDPVNPVEIADEIGGSAASSDQDDVAIRGPEKVFLKEIH